MKHTLCKFLRTSCIFRGRTAESTNIISTMSTVASGTKEQRSSFVMSD